ncbi:MAG TPA: hypothetical protein VFD92_07680 [Candidatus Binatia bacterium]|nr:hypothetical protein [Candidatus Binatia bacterium]
MSRERTDPFCRLDALDPGERARHAELLASLRAAVDEVSERGDGFRFRLRADPEAFARVAEWVGLERRCCPFLDFALEWRAGAAPHLDLMGEPAAKAFLAAMVR